MTAAGIVLALALLFTAAHLGRAAGKRAEARRNHRIEARNEVWKRLEAAIVKGDDPSVNTFTMVHALDDLIVARIKLAELDGDA